MINIINTLQIEIAPLLLDKGFTIENIHYYKGNNTKKGKLSLIIAKTNNNPVTIHDCSIVSKEVSILIDIKDLIKDPYILEVSSLGCEDILIFYNDFVNNIGKQIKVILNEEPENEFIATILKVISNKVILKKQLDKTNITLPIKGIKKATLIKT